MSTARKTNKKTKTATNELATPTERTEGGAERRSSGDRRGSDIDRRAFWRPTPDRRREERELGRRTTDRTA